MHVDSCAHIYTYIPIFLHAYMCRYTYVHILWIMSSQRYLQLQSLCSMLSCIPSFHICICPSFHTATPSSSPLECWLTCFLCTYSSFRVPLALHYQKPSTKESWRVVCSSPRPPTPWLRVTVYPREACSQIMFFSLPYLYDDGIEFSSFAFSFVFLSFTSHPCWFNTNFWKCRTFTYFQEEKVCQKVYSEKFFPDSISPYYPLRKTASLVVCEQYCTCRFS